MSIDPSYVNCYKITQAMTGEETHATHAHDFTATGTIVCGTTTIPYISRTRTYDYSLDHYFRRLNPFVVSNDAYPGGTTAGSDTVEETKATAISDSWSIIDCEVIYTDPRHDLIIYRKKTTTATYSQSSDNINTIPKYSNFALMPVEINSTTQIISSVDGVLETNTSVYNVDLNLTMAAADMFHVQYQFGWVPENYYAQNENALDSMNFADNNRDGWLMAMPTWISGAFLNKGFDEGMRIATDSTAASNDPVADSAVDTELLIDAVPQGSWAYSKNGDRFVSHKLRDSMFNKLVIGTEDCPIPTEQVYTNQGDDTYIEEASQHTAYYPIAPM